MWDLPHIQRTTHTVKVVFVLHCSGTDPWTHFKWWMLKTLHQVVVGSSCRLILLPRDWNASAMQLIMRTTHPRAHRWIRANVLAVVMTTALAENKEQHLRRVLICVRHETELHKFTLFDRCCLSTLSAVNIHSGNPTINSCNSLWEDSSMPCVSN